MKKLHKITKTQQRLTEGLQKAIQKIQATQTPRPSPPPPRKTNNKK